MTFIDRAVAREILDSRGQPTVEVDIFVEGKLAGRAMVPAGTSTGKAEAHELRDHDPSRYDGQGVQQAVGHIQTLISPRIQGLDPTDQLRLDGVLLEIEPSPQKSRLGGNTILGVSLAVAHAGAAVRGVPLFEHFRDLFVQVANQEAPGALYDERWRPLEPRMPLPMTNMISGGLHAGGNLDFQDILIMPVGAPNYRVGLEWTVRIYRRLGKNLQQAGYEGRLVGDEGGFGPRLANNRQAVEFVVQAIESADLQPGRDITIAIDVAATHFFEHGAYRLRTEGDRTLSRSDMVDRLEQWTNAFPISSIEDGLAEDDWEGWRLLTERLGKRVQIVGDDLFATNVERVRRGIESGVANSVLIKVNQIGTVTETLRTMAVAKQAGYRTVVSARSGETEDSTIADLAVGTAADQIKIGSIVRSERLAKYNQLLRIAEVVEP